jgi:hypothetical protein
MSVSHFSPDLGHDLWHDSRKQRKHKCAPLVAKTCVNERYADLAPIEQPWLVSVLPTIRPKLGRSQLRP